ncbi:MAG TPA: hypothetical protein VF192_17705 [Longimicrobiales bacterium]
MRFLLPSCLALSALVLAGCSRHVVVARPAPDAIVVNGSRAAPRSVRVPPGHYPPPGQCRLWYAGRPPGHQPPPVPCERLRGRVAGSGAFILFNGVAWDADYDWRSHQRRKPGSVPVIIVELTSSP